METVVVDLKTLGIEREKILQEAKLQISKKLYAGIQELIDITLLEEIIDNTYAPKTLPAFQVILPKIASSQSPEVSRKIKYTSRAIIRLNEQVEETHKLISNYTQQIQDDSISESVEEGMRILETYKERSKEVLNGPIDLKNWEEINSAIYTIL